MRNIAPLLIPLLVLAPSVPLLAQNAEKQLVMTITSEQLVGGMVSATVLTLVIIPSLYLLLNGWKLQDEQG